MTGRRPNRRPNRRASARRLPPPAETTRITQQPPAPRSRLGLVLAVLIGVWLGQVLANITGSTGDVLDILLVGATAVVVAMLFRRQARGYVEQRRPHLPGDEDIS